MSFAIIYILTGCALFLPLVILIIYVMIRRKKGKRRVRMLTRPQKIRLLNDLAEPFGFSYLEKQDIFTSKPDAWQRKYGYEALFDRTAVAANMVIDAWPVYFDYEGRTWMIEFWKGQYGINTGGEVGVYHAKEIVPPHLYRFAHFDAAEDYEIPLIQCRLERNGVELYELAEYYWWLTGFRMGCFSKPKELTLLAAITFDRRSMAEAFYEGLKRSGQSKEHYGILRNEVAVKFDFERKPPALMRLHWSVVQCCNRLLCRLYRILAYPFTETPDRLLFFYYQAPAWFRRLLRQGTSHDAGRKICGSVRHRRRS